MRLKSLTGVITIAMVCVGISAVPAQASIGSGASCQNQEQYQVDDTPGGTPIGNTDQITVTQLTSSTVSWSLNQPSQVGDCTARVTLSDSSVVWQMPAGGESYTAPGGKSITKVQIMASVFGVKPAGTDCGSPHHQSYDYGTSQTQIDGDTMHIITSPSSGPFDSTTGISIGPASGVLMCFISGGDSGTIVTGSGCNQTNWDTADSSGCSHTPASGEHVEHYDANAMNTPTPRTDLVPPTVSLTAPANGSPVSGSITIMANAADSDGTVTGVEFQLDGHDLGAGTHTGGSTWTLSWNSGSASNGSHTLTAISRDTGNNSSSPSSVTVTVSNSGNQQCIPPKVGTPPNCHCPTGTTGTYCHQIPPNQCVVPNVKGDSPKAAKAAIRANHCTVGKIHKPKHHPKHKHHLKVKRVSPTPGSTHPKGTQVNLTLVWR